MINKIFKPILNPTSLLSFWVLFLASPIFSYIRLRYIVNKNLFAFRTGLTTAFYYFPVFLSCLALVVLFTWFVAFMKGRMTKRHERTYFLISILSLIFLVAVSILLDREAATYPNYIYSHYGITIQQLQLMYFISALELTTFLASYTYFLSRRANSRWKFAHQLSSSEISAFLSLIGVLSLLIFSVTTFSTASTALVDARQGFEGRFGVDYKYVEVLANHTGNGVVIIHPPQGEKWPAIGNQPLLRYFLHPRVLVSGALVSEQNFADVTGEAYFVGIEPDVHRPPWPLVDASNKTIVFDERAEIKYQRLEVVFDSNMIKVFKIIFRHG